jgi:hypothetical protein
VSDAPEAHGWRILAEYGSLPAAEVDAACLRSEGLAARVWNVAALPTDVAGYRVVVEARDLEKACWLLKFPPVSGAELAFLATGQLPGEPRPDEASGG